MKNGNPTNVDNVIAVSLDWKIAATGDFDGDHRTDVLWKGSSGGLVVHYMNGPHIVSDKGFESCYDVPGFGRTCLTADNMISEGVGDLNNDGLDDVIWRDTKTGLVYVLSLTGEKPALRFIGRISNPAYRLAAVSDFNRDGTDDLIWGATNNFQIWEINDYEFSRRVISSPFRPIPACQSGVPFGSCQVELVGVGDFDGDKVDDMLFRDSNSGSLLLEGTASTIGGEIAQPGLDWNIEAVGDFNGDNVKDLFLRRPKTGETAVYLINGGHITLPPNAIKVEDLNWAPVK